jgi:hypothetical protein
MDTNRKHVIWSAIDMALHDVFVQLDREALEWLSGTETTTLVQAKALDVLDFIDPKFRRTNSGVSIEEAEASIADDIARARMRRVLML